MGHGSALRSQAETVRAILLPRERIDIARIVRFRLLQHIPSLDIERVHVCDRMKVLGDIARATSPRSCGGWQLLFAPDSVAMGFKEF